MSKIFSSKELSKEIKKLKKWKENCIASWCF